MDLLDAIRRDRAEKMASVEDKPVVFIAPNPAELLEDEVFDYALVDDLKQFVDLVYAGPESGRALCLLFGDDDLALVKLAAEREALFPCQFTTVKGIPNSSENLMFENEAFGLPDASYDRIVGDVVELKRQLSLMTEEELAQSAILREQKQRQRADGSVRPLIDFDRGVDTISEPEEGTEDDNAK